MKHGAVMTRAFLSLLCLAGCGSASAGATSGATATSGNSAQATATLYPTNTPYHDPDPFQVTFLQHYQEFPCPAEPTPTNLCYNLQDDPSVSSLGLISFNGTDILFAKQSGTSCGPATRTGAFMLTDGDTITVQATGTYCVPGYVMQMNFTVTGGTGQYQHASGGGTIAVGPAQPKTATEFWSGTIQA